MAAASFTAGSGTPRLARALVDAPYRQEVVYRVAGSGRPVVLLHGLGNSSARWSDLMDAFQQDYRLYAPDLPGHGQSPARLPWKLREVAEILASWMRQLALEQATIIGHSLGGALALLLAATRPELVGRLVLVNPAGLPIQQPLLRALTRAGLSFSARQYIRQVSRPGSPRSQQALALWQAAEDVLACDLRGELGAIRCPTTLIWGTRDPLLSLRSAVILQRLIAGAELVLLPHLRHQPHRANPDIFAAILRDLLGRDALPTPEEPEHCWP